MKKNINQAQHTVVKDLVLSCDNRIKNDNLADTEHFVLVSKKMDSGVGLLLPDLDLLSAQTTKLYRLYGIRFQMYSWL